MISILQPNEIDDCAQIISKSFATLNKLNEQLGITREENYKWLVPLITILQKNENCLVYKTGNTINAILIADDHCNTLPISQAHSQIFEIVKDIQIPIDLKNSLNWYLVSTNPDSHVPGACQKMLQYSIDHCKVKNIYVEASNPSMSHILKKLGFTLKKTAHYKDYEFCKSLDGGMDMFLLSL
eukprot:NODE_161_length_14984_cov_0.487000.p6 type:complete len:183 gc:universal NODE_161_length_14984_cov_0.487000:12036-12584(+)